MKIVLRGYFGHKNLGDDLLLLEALNKMPKEGNLFVVADNSESANNLEWFQGQRSFSIVKNHPQFADYQVFSGGGLFPTRKIGLQSFLRFIMMRLMSHKLIINGCGIVPKPKDILFPLWLKTLTYCSVRDNISAEYVSKFRSVANCGDLYWGNEKHYTNIRNGRRCLICLANPFTDEEKQNGHYAKRYRQFVEDCCTIITCIKEKGFETTYLPFFEQSDIKLFEDIQKRLGSNDKVLLRERDYDISKVDEIFSQYDLGFCMRFHSILLALKNTLPMVAICYDFKSKSMLEEAGLKDYGVDYGIRESQFFGKEFNLNVEKMQDILDKSLSDTNEYRKMTMSFYDKKHGQVIENYKKIFTQ